MQGFSRQDWEKLGQDIENELRNIEEKYGISLKVKNVKFGDNNADIKIHAAQKTSDGEVLTKEAENFKKYACLYGFDPEDLGRKFVVNNKTFKISGLNTRAKKMGLLAVDENRKTYKFNTSSVRKILD